MLSVCLSVCLSVDDGRSSTTSTSSTSRDVVLRQLSVLALDDSSVTLTWQSAHSADTAAAAAAAV